MHRGRSRLKGKKESNTNRKNKIRIPYYERQGDTDLQGDVGKKVGLLE